ncbi:MAG: DUF5723 family protein [Bacteroidales bacterium]|nr:DUF5723 family protein [Bacteroidales bacterium]
MKKIIFIIFTATFVFSLQAQTLRTSYFMDKYHNRHQRNPAMSPAWGYISLPVLGNIQLGLQSNMRLADFLFPVGDGSGQLTTFLNPDISSNDFLRRISRFGEALSVDANVGVLGFGFYTREHEFWSFDLNVRANGGMSIPKDFFVLLKDLDTGRTYNFQNLNASFRAYVEFAFGHARDLTDDIRVGGKFKFLVGVADVRGFVDNFSLRTAAYIDDVWTANTRGTGTVLGNFLEFEFDTATGIMNGIRTPDNFAAGDLFGGFGAAIDLGVVWNMDNFLSTMLPGVPFLNGFTASFGLTDLGFIRYRNSSQVRAGGEFIFDGTDLSFENSEFNIDFDHIRDEFLEMFDFRPTDATSGMARGLRTTMNAGLEYSFLNNMMSAGLLWSTHFGLPRAFNELTLSYNLRPADWFAISLSSSIVNGFFRSAGWAMNFTPKWGLNFFFGMDYVPFAWTPSWDELNDLVGFRLPFGPPIYASNINFNFGVSVPLGHNRHHNFPTRRERRDAQFQQHQEVI